MPAGRRSIRLGRDKALLPAGRNTLREEFEARLRKAAGDVMLNHNLHHKYLQINEFIGETVNTPEEWLAGDLRS